MVNNKLQNLIFGNFWSYYIPDTLVNKIQKIAPPTPGGKKSSPWGKSSPKLIHFSPLLGQIHHTLDLFLPFFSNFRRCARTFKGGRNSKVEIGG